MNSPDLSLILILEAVLPFFVLSIVLLLTILAGRKKLKQAAKMLILSVKSNEDKEKQAIISFLTGKLAIDEKLAKKNAKKIINERKFMIRNLVSGLLDKNVETLSQLNQDLCRVTARYHALDVAAPAPAEEVEEEPEETEEEADLKGEIKSLKQEVHITLTTLNNIFKEFSSMFGEDDIPDGQMSVDQIITAMESFSGKSAEQDDDAPGTMASEAAVEEIPVQAESEDEVTAAEDSLEAQLEESISEDPISEDQILEEPQAEESVAEESLSEQKSDEQSAELTEDSEQLDFSVDSAIDDIDSALDGLELDASDDEEEPDWGDAFAESGDKMEKDPD